MPYNITETIAKVRHCWQLARPPAQLEEQEEKVEEAEKEEEREEQEATGQRQPPRAVLELFKLFEVVGSVVGPVRCTRSVYITLFPYFSAFLSDSLFIGRAQAWWAAPAAAAAAASFCMPPCALWHVVALSLIKNTLSAVHLNAHFSLDPPPLFGYLPASPSPLAIEARCFP